jgi:serralysin
MALTKQCFCMCPLPHGLSPESAKTAIGRRAALLKEASWGPNPDITIAFLEGSASLRDRVKEAANLWISDGGAKVNLIFQNDAATADIRIAFAQGRGSWSYLGTQCKTIATHKPTMNYGWLNDGSSDSEVSSVVLHEFGHALGLIHEHQNPKQGINWDRDAVIADLSGPPNNWDPATIEHNMFRKYDMNAVIATSTDKDSIMMYQIPEHWTLDDFSTDFNPTLSARDKQLIREIYF